MSAQHKMKNSIALYLNGQIQLKVIKTIFVLAT